ncbi:MAG: hypothetical protein ACOYON_06875 [Fimbriimonas sp.]
MADVVAVWAEALPKIKMGVTGVGVWAALNACEPVALDSGIFVVGLNHDSGDLSGHLKLPQTKRLIEVMVGELLGETITLRVIEGTSAEDYEIAKRRDVERRRLQDNELAKMRAELQAKTSWEGVYEQLGRRYSAVSNKSLPQNRARFYDEALELVANARQAMEKWDDLAERNFARCVERVAQYTELPSTLVALQILQRSGEL